MSDLLNFKAEPRREGYVLVQAFDVGKRLIHVKDIATGIELNVRQIAAVAEVRSRGG